MDPNEIAIFQDKMGKLRTSNLSLKDIVDIIKGVTEINIFVFDSNGKKSLVFL